MDTSRQSLRHAKTYRMLLVLLAVLLMSGVSSAMAGPRVPTSPNAIVSDQGQILPFAGGVSLSEIESKATSMTAAPFVGSGASANGNLAGTRAPELMNDQLRTAPPTVSAPDTQGAQPNSLYVDTRYRIASPASYPNSAVVLITMSNAGKNYRCSGSLIGRNTVVTAGHCLFFSGQWVSNVRVYPGYTGVSAPYGSCTAWRLYSVLGWTRDRNGNFDYGAIKLNCTIGYRTGWLGYRWTSASLNTLFTKTAGYPVDKGYQQWGSNGRVTYSAPRQLRYTNFTTPGFNGAPVYDSGRYVVAVHRVASPWGASWGLRITSDVFQNLKYWTSL